MFLAMAYCKLNTAGNFPEQGWNAIRQFPNTYRCKDEEWIYLAATNFEVQYQQLCLKVFDRPDLAANSPI